MKAKDYLMQVKRIDKLIKNKLIEKEQWLTIATSTTTNNEGERVQSSGSQQKMADAVHKMVEIDAEIYAYIDRLVDTKKDVIETIEQIPVSEYDVLHQIYIQGKDFCEVVDVNGKPKSKSWATTIHGRALKNVQSVLDNRNENE